MSSIDPNAEIIARLDALVAQVARLTAAVAVRPNAIAAAQPKRLTTKQVMAQLGICRTTLQGYVARDLCQQVRPSGRRDRHSRVYYLPDEIDALAISEDAARELMARKRRLRR